MSYVGTELHANVARLFNPQLEASARVSLVELYHKKLTYLNDNILADNEYTVDNKLSIADIYLYIALSWSPYIGVDNSAYSNVVAFSERVGGLKQVKAAHARMATNPATSI